MTCICDGNTICSAINVQYSSVLALGQQKKQVSVQIMQRWTALHISMSRALKGYTVTGLREKKLLIKAALT